LASVGLGAVTGLYSTYSFQSAILIDNKIVYDNVKKSLEASSSEREGYTGVRSVVGGYKDLRLALVQIPPYPQAVVEVVSELYLLGARRIILIGRGYRLSRRLPPDTVLITMGAIPRDAVSQKIAPRGAPLLASQPLYSKVRGIASLRFPDIEWVQGLTVTLDSLRMKWVLPEAEDLVGTRGVFVADSLVAPLYALQYEYGNLEAVALITAFRQYGGVPTPIESPADAYSKLLDKEAKIQNILYTVALEALASRGEEG